MPKANLPSSPQGWVAALAASLVGLLAGFWTITILNRVL